MTTVQQIQAVRVQLSAVEEAPWNVNVVPPDKFAQLKSDMKAAGPEGTDPVDTCVLEGKKYTCDGAHRLRAAKQLGWDHLYEIQHPEITTEEQARLFNYKRDADRGDIDPFRLATSFKWFTDHGLTQEKVAAKFGVSQEKVSSTLVLLKVDETAKKELSVIPRGISPSAFEALARQPAPVQQVVARQVAKSSKASKEGITVRDLDWTLEQARREYDRAHALQVALQDPRVKPELRKCPECKAAPRELETSSWERWPGSVLVVSDSNYHRWCLSTGPRPKEERRASRSGSGSSRPPQHEKSKVGTKVYAQAVRNFFDAIWPKLTDVDHIDWSGKTSKSGRSLSFSGAEISGISVEGAKLNGKRIDLYICFWSYSGGVDVRFGNIDFKFEPNGTTNKDFETYVKTSTQMSTRKALHALEEGAVDFLEEYGKLPRGNNPDWLRIQKRKARK
ncbi:MAG: ParB/RepB/Spo0J family partition protein [Elusimicrobia bacterium]|nr:ParB/RepB/Spo0J family partition protein [Elusimicrobiota bacterium]